MNTFGEKIKYLRQEKGLTQKQMADSLSITVSTLSHWECGYQEPAFSFLKVLCSFFDVEADYLIGLKTESGTILPIQEKNAELSPDGKELLEYFYKLPPDLRHRALSYTKKLVELSQEENGITFPQETSARPSNRRKA